MSVYVDNIWYRPFVSASNPLRYSCHLMADAPEELAEFAKRLGLNKSWKHGDHYDLTRARRAKAVAMGAKEITSREMVAMFRSQSQ